MTRSRDWYREVADGLLYTHGRLNANTQKTLEASSFLYALIELLGEKGLLDIGELDRRKEAVSERLMARLRQNGTGTVLQDPEYDKYTFEAGVVIDCEHRVDLCCRLPFALSKQDIREGVVRWELGQPYLIAHDGEGTCCHLDPETRACEVWEKRPVPCRGFDCRNDARIWRDFEKREINPDVTRPDWPACLAEKNDSVSRNDK
jgi:Fe-S-cluster containining protein